MNVQDYSKSTEDDDSSTSNPLAEITLPAKDFIALRERLTEALHKATVEATAELRLDFNTEAFLRQASVDTDEIVTQILALGCGVTIGEDDPQTPDLNPTESNVVPFPVVSRGDLKRRVQIGAAAAALAIIPVAAIAQTIADIDRDGQITLLDAHAAINLVVNGKTSFKRTVELNGTIYEMEFDYSRAPGVDQRVVRMVALSPIPNASGVLALSDVSESAN